MSAKSMPSDSTRRSLTEESPSVQSHLAILQGVIDRMATNSTSSKTWCITIVSALLVVIANQGKPNYALLALIPTFLFLTLDAYYLALEKGFRNSYKSFVQKLHDGTLLAEDLYSVAPSGDPGKLRIEALISFSVWGFYLSITFPAFVFP